MDQIGQYTYEKFLELKSRVLDSDKPFPFEDFNKAIITLFVGLDEDPTKNLHEINRKLSQINACRENVFKIYGKVLDYSTKLNEIVESIEDKIEIKTKEIVLQDQQALDQKNRDMKEAVARVKLNDWYELLLLFKLEYNKADALLKKITERSKILEAARSSISRQLAQIEIIAQVEGLGPKKIRLHSKISPEDVSGNY